MDFRITSIHIDDRMKDSSFMKILEPGEYKFMDETADKVFYIPNVSISSIVGKNGSGKSTLFDLMFRIINNWGFVLNRLEHIQDSSYHIGYVPGIYADIHYTVGDIPCSIGCRGFDMVCSINGQKFVYYSRKNELNPAPDIGLHEFALRYLFYTIVTNYSVQSFLSSDYDAEKTIEMPLPENAYNAYDFNQKRKESRKPWIDDIFHKNDGYFTPIVLNPFRSNGVLDMARENKLTISRLIPLLTYFKLRGISFLDGYDLHHIEYYTDISYWVGKVLQIHRKTDSWGIHDVEGHLREFVRKVFVKGEDIVARYILELYGIIDVPNKDSEIPLKDRVFHSDAIVSAQYYIVYKTLSLPQNYPSLSKYRDTYKYHELFRELKEDTRKEELRLLVEEILKDKDSHISLKIRQALNFLNKCRTVEGLQDGTQKIFAERFTDEDFYDETNIEMSIDDSILELQEKMPPAFFNAKVYLSDHAEKEAKPRPYESLSSGEKQFAAMASTIAYHTINISSIKDEKRMRYDKINLVLDEVEISFHPEYQRMFVYDLLRLIERLNLNERHSFNIIIATHSPFILSDIPSNRILYMKRGKADNSISMKTFGANVNDLLATSFFLENGFMGEFARRKMASLVDYIEKGTSDEWTEEKAQTFIDEILGEPLLKQIFQQLYDEKNFYNAHH